MNEFYRGYQPGPNLNDDLPEDIERAMQIKVQEGYDNLTLTFDLADDTIQADRNTHGPTDIPGDGSGKINGSYGD